MIPLGALALFALAAALLFCGGCVVGFAWAKLRRSPSAVVDLPVHRARQRRGASS